MKKVMKIIAIIALIALVAWGGFVCYAWLDCEFVRFSKNLGKLVEEAAEMASDNMQYILLGVPTAIGIKKLYNWIKSQNVSKEKDS